MEKGVEIEIDKREELRMAGLLRGYMPIDWIPAFEGMTG